MPNKYIYLFFLIVFFSVQCKAYDLVVAKDGTGNYSTVQAAIDATPAGRTAPFLIFIKQGMYKEKISIPSNKTFIHLIGENVANTILTYNDGAAKLIGCGATLGTQNSASFSVNANDFAAFNLTIENSYGDGSQAVAVLANADRVIFVNCRFLGNQDTLYLKGSGNPRCYFKKCYIDGNIDFIFGSAVAMFDSCVVYAKTRTTTTSSYITAPNTPQGQNYGFVFHEPLLPVNRGATNYYLSRPWPSPSEAQTAQKVVFIKAKMSSHIFPAGWSVWNANTLTGNLFFAENKSAYFNGNLIDTASRVSWSKQLTDAEASVFSISNVFSGWDPCAVSGAVCAGMQPIIAVSNFKADKNVSATTVSWNISWPMSGIQYELFRSSDNINYQQIFSETGLSDSLVNYQYTDANVPPIGGKFYYYLKASKTGLDAHVTDTLLVSNEASVLIDASPALYYCGFSQVLGTPSATQTFSIAATNLSQPIAITAPTNFEVSADGVTWYASSGSLTILPISGSVNSTLQLRLNATAVGIYTGQVVVSASGIANQTFDIKGRTVAPSRSDLLQFWPLTSNTSDSLQLRSPAVDAGVCSLMNLKTTDGTLPTPAGSVPAYSLQYGQAFGANDAGNNWQNVGGTLKRTYYQEFIIRPLPGNNLKIDSVGFFTNFYGTNSGLKMSVAYSKNGFVSPADSAEYTDGVGPTGSVLSFNNSGTFTKAFVINQNNGGAVDNYSIALNGANGVNVTAGEKIHIRLYWSCSSTGTPRFGLLKNFRVMGVANGVLPVKFINCGINNTKNGNNIHFDFEGVGNHFVIERSYDGIRFDSIGNRHHTAGLFHISFIDPSKFKACQNLFYRVQAKDVSGETFYSPIMKFTASCELSEFSYSIPSKNLLRISGILGLGVSNIQILSTDGRVMIAQNLPPNLATADVDISSLSNGVFLIVLKTKSGNYSKLFLTNTQ